MVRLLDHGYSKCANCFVTFPPAALVTAAKHALSAEPDRVDRRINLAQSLTSAGKPFSALAILKQTTAASPGAHQIANLEMARAHLICGKPQAAKNTLLNQLADAEPIPPALRASYLTFLAEACLALGQDLQSEGALRDVLGMAFIIPYEIAVTALEIIADIYQKRGDQELHSKAFGLISEIVETEEKDPWMRARAHAASAVARAALGQDVKAELSAALRVLRKRKTMDPTVERAAHCLADAVKVRRRLRERTRPEDI